LKDVLHTEPGSRPITLIAHKQSSIDTAGSWGFGRSRRLRFCKTEVYGVPSWWLIHLTSLSGEQIQGQFFVTFSQLNPSPNQREVVTVMDIQTNLSVPDANLYVFLNDFLGILSVLPSLIGSSKLFGQNY
jgi:hypothetical protein